MGDLAQRVAAVIHHRPRGICFACLARVNGIREHDVRAVALVLITRAGLLLARRSCSECHRVDDVLAVRKVG